MAKVLQGTPGKDATHFFGNSELQVLDRKPPADTHPAPLLDNSKQIVTAGLLTPKIGLRFVEKLVDPQQKFHRFVQKTAKK